VNFIILFVHSNRTTCPTPTIFFSSSSLFFFVTFFSFSLPHSHVRPLSFSSLLFLFFLPLPTSRTHLSSLSLYFLSFIFPPSSRNTSLPFLPFSFLPLPTTNRESDLRRNGERARVAEIYEEEEENKMVKKSLSLSL